ncbi:hypothetical protein NEUTE1DRAFT_145240 [Neurospora tetrasperma FGSC 2508]|uniref:Uncharacterized protein n=1 Tax=Neurospora tetrasperma (strain FGSC 2508 / ATCC MYA-4615 / P0657) TaxID=510951 RepID=F8MFB1_NEUT8|nr:uncharacterized protein NEUTE1DRAFT_145240 [Neurospora tetrasperma FGSC 2508]EGO59170.1 hypothetical protein NEUTE1DRAFT_145240 [Neurospora tetrasperma FGSC 2508]EGZ73281.1 hypothetical protein NEUTE2DRAFT_156792 [Neurospora tetrasperma FGSC 2509]
MYAPESTWTRAFLAVAVVQALIASSLEAYVLIAVERCFEPAVVQVPRGHTVPLFFALFIFGFVYQLILVYDALRSSSMIQVVGLCVYNLCLLGYALFQPKDIKDALDSLAGSITADGKPLITPGTNAWGDCMPALAALALVVAVATGVFCFVAWKLRSEFAWVVYKAINADRAMRKRILILQSYTAFLKFDLFFLLGFLLQNMINASADMGRPEFGLSIGAIPLVLLVIWLAVVCAQSEYTVGTLVIILVQLAAAGFLCYKLTTIDHELYMFRTFAAITLIMTLCAAAMAVLCLVNFGKGVKNITESQLRQKSTHNLPDTDYASSSYLYGYVPRRSPLDA